MYVWILIGFIVKFYHLFILNFIHFARYCPTKFKSVGHRMGKDYERFIVYKTIFTL